MKEEQPVFKVTDRRLFNADGSPRDVSPAEQPETKPQPAAEKPAEAPATAVPFAESSVSATPAASAAPTPAVAEPAAIAEPDTLDDSQAAEEDFDEVNIPDATDPASFINFAMSIASNAASALGLMEHPVTKKREVDLELGKHWIDVLGMLQRKTKGNLSPQEEQIVESWLADLRMQFVSLSSAAPVRAAGFTGRDIIGGK